MPKKRRIILIISVVIIIFTASVGTVCVYAAVGIDYESDEALFSAAKSSSITKLYYDVSGNNASDIEKYIASDYESVSYGGARKLWYSYDEISEYLKQGFVAVEDRSFFEHGGVDVKRTLGAFLNYISGRASYGGSTITQQVVKNISGDNEHTLKRKFNEVLRAMKIENRHSKEDIFEIYLNIVPMSENIVGVGVASKEYFGKNPSQLSIAEAATLIGIANAPTRYNPYNYPTACKKKRDTVLSVMYSRGCITDQEYAQALSSEIVLKERSNSSYGTVSWFAETVLSDIVYDLAKQRGISVEAAKILVYSGGFSVYTTVEPEVQKILESYFENPDNFPDGKEGLEFAMTVCSSATGNLVATVGARGEKNANKIMNYADMPRTPGSVLKPLGLYAPLIDSGKISWSTVFDDVPVEFHKNEDGSYREYPHNYPDVYSGLITVSDALRLSKNTVAVKLYNMLGAKRIYRTLNDDYRLHGLVESEKTDDGRIITDLAPSPLALGQLSHGVTLRSLTSAYTVFPKEGNLSRSRSYLAVFDSEGRLVLDNRSDNKSVISPEAARVMTQLLVRVTDSGTASKITLKEAVDVAGKTGTSGADKDRWFIGFTPYYTAGIWCGYRDGKNPVGNQEKNHLAVWDAVMCEIHGGIGDDNLKSFSTEGLLYRPYCMDSGELYSEVCRLDPRGARIDFGYFIKGSEPLNICDRHILCRYDTVSGGIDVGGCPELCSHSVALLNVASRSFPEQIYITDAQYVFRPIGKTAILPESEDMPYFAYSLPQGEYVGISRGKKQFNRACRIHG